MEQDVLRELLAQDLLNQGHFAVVPVAMLGLTLLVFLSLSLGYLFGKGK